MAVRTVKARVLIEGEKEYKNAIESLNRENKVLSSEMRKLKAQFGENAKSTEFLTEKGRILSDRLDIQRKKTEEARVLLEKYQKALDEVKQELGESSDVYKDLAAKIDIYTAKINNSEAAEYDLQHAIEENNRVLDYQQSETKQASDALENLDRESRLLASEMRRLAAEYQDNADDAGFLQQKTALLSKELEKQQGVSAQLRRQQKEAADTYGETSKQAQELQIKLNDSEAAEYNLEHAIRENNAALEDQGTEMVGLGDGINDLTGKLGIHLPDAAKEALNGMGEFSAGSVAKLGLVAGTIAATIELMKQLQHITMESADKVDEILTESSVTGLSARTIQELKYAEELIDVSYGTISGSLTKLTKNMASARDGNESLAAAFQRLGVSITDTATGQLRPAEAVFYDAIDALGQIENQTERDALTMQHMGKSAQELNPLIEQGSRTLKAYAAEAEAAGYILDESQLKKLAEVDDAYQKLQLQIEAAKDELALDFAPASVSAMELFGKAVNGGAQILDKSGLLENTGLILSNMLDIGGSVLDLIGSIPGLDQALGALKVTLGAVAQLVAIIADGFDAVAGLVTLDFDRVGTALGLHKNSGQLNNYQRTYMAQDGTLAAYEAMWSKNDLGSSYYDEQTGRYVGNFGLQDTGTRSSIYWDRLNGVWRYTDSGEIATATYNGRVVTQQDLEALAEVNGWNASGNQNWRGGLTYLSENGQEAAILPQGTRIYSAQETAALSGGDTYNFTVNVRDLEDLDRLIRWAKSARVRERMK